MLVKGAPIFFYPAGQSGMQVPSDFVTNGGLM